ncbi:methylmalonyl-CoA mutase family protein [Nocardioides marinquilinus]|uniref:Methylmalonyl-CoA mutase family protein n=1 Tax=Nocardioides marinquilinus TaxID=1210400 RepID=A0ABP9PPB4_9ACTN
MTDVSVEGGLDEPTGLEPEQGALRLVQPGDEHTQAEWESAAAAVLRKARRLREDDDDALVWPRLTRTTLDGVEVAPLGVPGLLDDVVTAGRPDGPGEWDVRAHLDLGTDPRADNEALLADLEGGVTSLWLTAHDVEPDAVEWPAVLGGVLLDLAPVVLPGDAALAEAFLEQAEQTGQALHPRSNLGLDARAATGEQAALAADAGVLGFVVDATGVHDRGASDVQELAWAMAAVATYLRRLAADGVDVARAAALVELRLAATDEQFPTIAKLRAVRRLWHAVLEHSGVEQVPMRLHAVTSRPMMSRYDAYTNLLRTTVAAFAAGVSGADAVTVLPFDSPLGRPERLGRRLARNTSALLVSESHLARVVDPAGGAWAVEKLTDDLAVAAWRLFGELDESTDLDAAVDARIAETVERRTAEIATRRRPITGLTEFPVVDETLPERAPSTGWDDVRPWGAAFEALRDDPPRERVLLATLGTVAEHTARATFAANLLAAGGIGADAAGVTEGPDDLVAVHAGQPVAVLAGSDAAYEQWGEAAASALREAGVRHVVVAGQPAEWADDSCALGVDAHAFLTRTREALS